MARVVARPGRPRRGWTRKPAAEPEADEPADKAEEAEPEQAEPGDETELVPFTGELDEEQVQAVETGDPAEEPTEPADAEAVSKLGTEVLVVDEYPRYHVAECPWLSGRDTIPIAVKEARDLGFSPCARCTPDAKLLAAAKSKR